MLRRMGMIIAVGPEKIVEYQRLHAEPWPEMDQALNDANIHNYSIYLREPENLLFGYWEYTGSDFESDMKILGEKPVCRRWLALTDPCQKPLDSAAKGEWRSMMPEVFHLD